MSFDATLPLFAALHLRWPTEVPMRACGLAFAVPVRPGVVCCRLADGPPRGVPAPPGRPSCLRITSVCGRRRLAGGRRLSASFVSGPHRSVAGAWACLSRIPLPNPTPLRAQRPPNYVKIYSKSDKNAVSFFTRFLVSFLLDFVYF